MALEQVFSQLEQIGVFDVLLPFALVFTIVFAVLNKAKIFGPESRKFNIMIALVMGMGVVFPHVMGLYPPDSDIVLIINHSLPNVSVVLVAIVMALLIIGVMGARVNIGGNSLSGWIAFAAFGVVAYIFGSAANWWQLPTWLYFLDNPDMMALILVILVFAIMIWFITKEDKEKEEKKQLGYKLGQLVSPIDQSKG